MVELRRSFSALHHHRHHHHHQIQPQQHQLPVCSKLIIASSCSFPSHLFALILVLVACPMTFSSGRRGRSSSRVSSSSSASPSFSYVEKTAVLQRLPEKAISLASPLPDNDVEVLTYLVDFGYHSLLDGPSPPGNKQRGWKPWKNSCSSSPSSLASSPRFKVDNAPDVTAHQPSLACDCFVCYCSFWNKWNISPNRAIIDEVLDLFDGHLQKCRASAERTQTKNRQSKKEASEKESDVRRGKLSWQKSGKEDSNKRTKTKAGEESNKSAKMKAGEESRLCLGKKGMPEAGAPAVAITAAVLSKEEAVPTAELPSISQEAGAVDEVITSLIVKTSPKKQQQQQRVLGKHKNNQVIPLDFEGCQCQASGDYEEEEVNEQQEDGISSANESEKCVDAATAGGVRVVAGDTNLRGRGFLGRVFPDALGGLASRLWDLVSLRMRSHTMDFY